MRTMVAVPCMDTVQTFFFKSCLELNPVDEMRFFITSATLIYDARNRLAESAVREGFDRVLWLDSDMTFAPDTMERLSARLDEGREFVSGLYVRRKDPYTPVVFSEIGIKDINGGRYPVAETADIQPDIFEVAGAGLGVCMMTVDLIKRIGEKFGLPFSPILGFGEDLSFCMRAAQLGVKMYCDPAIVAGHIGYREYIPGG